MANERLHFADVAQWENWLDANYDTSDGVVLVMIKKGSQKSAPTVAEALEVALCYGWIDGKRQRLDDDFFLQGFSPRRRASPWSQINRTKVQALIDAGRMRAAGHAEIERAKGDGRWDAAYAPARDRVVPEDLQAALDANPKAAAFFEALDSQNRFAVVFRIGNVKRTETRARKIAEFVAMLERGETIYPRSSRRESSAASAPSPEPGD
jgi:uncharacterized protein YdeI (YjbR/CyaY-like superfamily)